MLDLFKNVGSTEILIVILILVIIFGANRISDIAKRGGETLKEVKKIKKDLMDATKDDTAT